MESCENVVIFYFMFIFKNRNLFIIQLNYNPEKEYLTKLLLNITNVSVEFESSNKVPLQQHFSTGTPWKVAGAP